MSVSRRSVIIAAAAFALPIPVGASARQHWYVDGRVGGSGDGRSWASAWKRPADIRWGNIQPGDTILISGGADGLTYTDSLEIRRSGEEGLPITVAAAVDPGHSGEVIFDFNDTENRVRLRDCAHVVLTGFTLRGGDSGSVLWLRDLRGGVVISDNVIETSDRLAGGNARGIDVRQCSGAFGVNVLLRNRITTPARTIAQADGIYAMDNGDHSLRIEGNAIYVNNTDSTGHSDCIQSFRDGSMVIVDNLFRGPTAGGHNHSVWIEDIQDGSHIDIRGNRSVSRNGSFNLTVWRSSRDAGTGTAAVVGNEVVGGSRALNFERNTGVVAFDNVVEPDETGVAYFIGDEVVPPRNIQRNSVYARGRVATVLNRDLTWAAWQRRGYDLDGVLVDRVVPDESEDAA